MLTRKVPEAPESSRTFDFHAGDVAYIPVPESHYIENVGDTDVVVLEVLQAEKFTDMSMGQWLALTPPQIIKDTLGLPDDVIAHLSKDKPIIIMGNTDLTETNFTRE
jgi:oxalate decarboxylase/phosphoglucose isomerase-like protein (cupin superfamily)